jgi:hypothetical protein
MKTKLTYILDKTKDNEKEYAVLLDGIIFATNLLKSQGDVPKEIQSFDYNIVEDVENQTLEYTFIMEMGSELLNSEELRETLLRALGGR